MEISKMLTLSTAHVCENTANMLDRLSKSNSTKLCVVDRPRVGWYIIVTQKTLELARKHDKALPTDLANLILLADDMDCGTLCLDRDAEPLPYLAMFDW